MFKKFVAILVLSSLALMSAAVFAHGGGLDQEGGHYNRKTGQYHKHR